MTTGGSTAVEVVLEGGLPLACGEQLAPCTVGLRRYGRRGAPAVLVLGGISAGREVAPGVGFEGWWSDQVGPGRPLDTERLEIIGFDWLGGRGRSTSPRSGESFPPISTADQALAIVSAGERAGIGPFEAVVGASYGGMVALAMAEQFPDWCRRLVVISAPARSHPMAIALRDLQRRIVRLGQQSGAVRESLALARGLAITTYRTSREFRGRFPHRPGIEDGGVESYLQHHGRRFADSWTAEQFLVLSESMDDHAVDPATIAVPALFAGALSDSLVPPWQLRELHREWAGPSRLVLADSRFGHDAFLKESAFIAGVIRAGLTEQEPSCTSTPSPRGPGLDATDPSERSSRRSTSARLSPSPSSRPRDRTTTPARPTQPAIS